MKILHVLSQKPGFTGSGYYFRALLAQSARAGHQTASVIGLDLHDECDLHPVYPVRFETESLPFPVVGMSDVMPYRSSLWRDLSEADLKLYELAFKKALLRAVTEFEPDVIHCHHFWLLTALTRELFPDHRVVASCHGTGLRQHEKLPQLGARFLPALARLDHGYGLTEDHLGSLGYLNGRTSVVGAGFDATIFHSEKRSAVAKGRALYAGKLANSKGCRELLTALEPLLNRGLVLSMAGSGHGQEAEILSASAQALGVAMLGRLEQPELAEEMRRAQIFILPSYYEGLPLVVAEALSCGCQVITTQLPGIMDWLPKELIESGWVRLVPLPRLSQADQPFPSDLPLFVENLREAVSDQLYQSPKAPRILESFLKENSWSGVYERIALRYRV